MIRKMFKSLIRSKIEAYIDDMVVKSKAEPSHLKDLAEVFAIL